MKKTIAERIYFIKRMRDEHDLTVSLIADIVSENGDYVSERTLYKILADGSEEETFQPHSIIAVVEALTAKYGDLSLPDDVAALRQLVTARNRHIDSLVLQMENQAEEYAKREALFEERKAYFERTISLLESQLQTINARLNDREEVIARKDAILEKMIEEYLSKKE